VTVTAEQLTQWKALAGEVIESPSLNFYWEVDQLCAAVPALIEALEEAQREINRLHGVARDFATIAEGARLGRLRRGAVTDEQLKGLIDLIRRA
jgi:hypothetical protein